MPNTNDNQKKYSSEIDEIPNSGNITTDVLMRACVKEQVKFSRAAKASRSNFGIFHVILMLVIGYVGYTVYKSGGIQPAIKKMSQQLKLQNITSNLPILNKMGEKPEGIGMGNAKDTVKALNSKMASYGKELDAIADPEKEHKKPPVAAAVPSIPAPSPQQNSVAIPTATTAAPSSPTTMGAQQSNVAAYSPHDSQPIGNMFPLKVGNKFAVLQTGLKGEERYSCKVLEMQEARIPANKKETYKLICITTNSQGTQESETYFLSRDTAVN